LSSRASINIILDNEECMPYKKNSWDAGWDLRSNNETFTLAKGGKVKVHTGVKIEVPRRHMGLILPRSGLGCNSRVGLANTAGCIDSDYRGELMVFLVNDGHMDVEIKQYDRFAQLIIVPVALNKLRVIPNEQLSETERGEGGFGSTGTE